MRSKTTCIKLLCALFSRAPLTHTDITRYNLYWLISMQFSRLQSFLTWFFFSFVLHFDVESFMRCSNLNCIRFANAKVCMTSGQCMPAIITNWTFFIAAFRSKFHVFFSIDVWTGCYSCCCIFIWAVLREIVDFSRQKRKATEEWRWEKSVWKEFMTSLFSKMETLKFLSDSG